MITVHDEDRKLSFRGTLLASSSSETDTSVRWIEFDLYKTEGGQYVVSRTGVSLVYHMPTCELAEKYALEEWEPLVALNDDSYPCEICNPTGDVPYVCPETTRHWARVSEDARGVIQALYKKDGRGIRYITKVAARLLENAADADDQIARAYYHQTL